jgi:hypothetical protein
MKASLRYGIHFGLIASFLLAFAQAPFSHAHASDPHHKHSEGFAHTHWKDHSSTGPAWKAMNPDSDARALNWIAGDGKSPVKFEAVLREPIVLPVVATRVSRITELTPHNHDPPWRTNLNPRAPPV